MSSCIKCNECKEDVGSKCPAFNALKKYVSESQALDDLEVKKECCRRALVGLSAVDFGQNPSITKADSPEENPQEKTAEKPTKKGDSAPEKSPDDHTVKTNQSKRSRGSFVAKIKSVVKPKKSRKQAETTPPIPSDEGSKASTAAGSDRTAGAEVITLIDSIYKHLNDRGVNGKKRKDKTPIEEVKKEIISKEKEKLPDTASVAKTKTPSLVKATKQEASDHPSTTGKSKASTKKESTIGELAQESVEQPVPDEPSTTNKSKASATKESVNGKPAQEESGKLGYVASTKGSTTMTAKKNDIDKSAPEEQEQPASASMASSTKKSKALTQKESLPANVAPEDTNKPATASVASSSKKSKASLEKESAPEKQAVERTEQEASKASSTKKSKASTREEVATEKEASKTSSKKKTVATPEEALALYDSLFQDIAKVGSEDEKSDKPIPTEVCFSPKSSEADVAANALQEETPLTPPTKSSVGGTVKSAPEKVQPKLSLVKMFRTLSYRSATSSKSGKGAKIQPLEPFTIKEEPDIVICTGKVDGEIELRPSSYKGYDSLTDAKDVSPAEDIEAAVTKEESPEVQTQGKTAEPEQTESSSPEAIPEVGVSASEKKFLALSDGLKAEAKEGRDPVELARSMESDISKDWNDISKTFTVESATKITELSKGIEVATEKTKEDAPKTGEVFLPPVKGGKPPKAQKKKKQKSKQEKSKKNQLKKNQPVDDDTASCSTASDSVTHDARLAESVMKNCSACDVAFPFNGYFKKLSNF